MQRVNEAHERSRLVRTIDDIVWTAMRENALHVALPDGRRLLIGGEVSAYGDDYADPWIYTDIIVTHADGAIENLTYPRNVFAHAGNLVGVTRGADVFIFGTLDEKRHPRARGSRWFCASTRYQRMVVEHEGSLEVLLRDASETLNAKLARLAQP